MSIDVSKLNLDILIGPVPDQITVSKVGLSVLVGPSSTPILVPSSGPSSGGTTVTITGEDVSSVTGVLFNGIPATDVTVVNEFQITCVTPAVSSGIVDVTLQLASDEILIEDAFTYLAGHQYWRLNCAYPHTRDGGYVGFNEIELREASGETNLVSGITPTSNRTPQAGSLAGVTDGTTGSLGVQFNATLPVYIVFDFGEGNAYDVKHITIWPNSDDATRTPGYFTVEYSDDGSTWIPYWVVKPDTWTAGVSKTFELPNLVNARYWMLTDFVAELSANSFAEIELRDIIGGSDLTGSGTASASDFFDGSTTAAHAVDNNAATLWSSTDAIKHWWQYDFGDGNSKSIIEVMMQARASSFYNQTPNSFTICKSADGISWQIAWTVDDDTSWTSNEIREFAEPVLSSGAHRYWRINILKGWSDQYIGYAEVEFRDVLGGPDLTGSGTPIGTEWVSVPTEYPQFAYDDINTTRWQFEKAVGQTTGGRATGWIGYDFGEGNEKSIIQVRVRNLHDTGGRNLRLALVEWSDDGSNWTAEWAITETSSLSASADKVYSRPVTSNTLVHWGMLCTEVHGADDYPFGATELIFKDEEGNDLEVGGTATSSNGSTSGFPASNAFDRNTGTFFIGPQGTGTPMAIYYQHTAGVMPVEYDFQSRNDEFGPNESPKDWYILASNNGVEWLVKDIKLDQDPWEAGELRNFTLDLDTSEPEPEPPVSNFKNSASIVMFGNLDAVLGL